MNYRTIYQEILNGEAVLFLGAGFSIGNRCEGGLFKTGTELAHYLCDTVGNAQTDNLNIACSRYLNHFADWNEGIVPLLEELKKQFLAKSICESHEWLLSLPWKRIYTTNYDNLAAIFDGLKRINTILIDLNRDFWQYISMEYFKQKIKAGEIGSSAMPHKVNPIDFENAEGNLGIANAILEHLATKLPVSRLQRDLTDSTVLRNVGVPLAHIEIAFKSLTKGLGKLLLNESALSRDLNNCWAVVAEGIQTVLRREGYPKPYEALKALTRTNQTVTEQSIKEFIETLNVSDRIKDELRAITPHNYTGI